MSDLIHLTYASEDNYHLHRLLTSAGYLVIRVQVLGLDRPRKGLLHKLQGLRGFLRKARPVKFGDHGRGAEIRKADGQACLGQTVNRGHRAWYSAKRPSRTGG